MVKKFVEVDVLAANFNNAKYLRRFLESLLDSSVLPEQVILVDDASTDNSIEVINEFESSKLNIRLICLEKNVGFANALNKGLEYVKSKYVLRIDPDDLIHCDRIKKQYDFLQNNPDIDVLGCDVQYFVDDEENITGASNFPINHNVICESYRSGGHGVCHGATMFRKECFFQEKYVQANVPAEEFDLFSRLLLAKFKFANLKEVLTSVRIHGVSVSNNMPFSTVKRTFMLRDQLWSTKTSRFFVYKEYWVRNLYRRYIAMNGPKRYLLLSLVALLKPSSVLKRLVKK